MANFAIQRGAPIKGSKKRTLQFPNRISPDEKAQIEELRQVLSKRRKENFSTMDLLMYCVNVVYTREDFIRVISKTDNE